MSAVAECTRGRRAVARGGRIAALTMLLSLSGVGGDDPIPWPSHAPTEAELRAQLQVAQARASQARGQALADAAEAGTTASAIGVVQADIDAGQFDVAALATIGATVFEHRFSSAEGWGDAGGVAAPRRVHDGARGGLDAFSCAACHTDGGAGTLAQNTFAFGDGARIDTALVRNAPSLHGAGLVQALAAEMTGALQTQRMQAQLEAEIAGAAVVVSLRAKGVDFGRIGVAPDGTVDPDDLQGVDDDLVVRPFGWKGSQATLRRVIEDEARVHFGLQAETLAGEPDGDGVDPELTEGALTATAVYLARLDTPQIVPPHDAELRDRWARGSGLFDELGCASCHVRELALEDPTWAEVPDTTGGPPVTLALLEDGDAPRGTARVQLFSDLKRHDLGPDLADPFVPAGSTTDAATFLTRPLWGLAESGPYLHDGRAPTIPVAILAHGGEAQAARDAFVALPASSAADLHVFLLSLSRAPRLRVPR